MSNTPVPSSRYDDLVENMQDLDAVVNSTESTVTLRGASNGLTASLTLSGALAKLGYEPPIEYASGIVFSASDTMKTIDRDGIVYAALPSELPITTSGTWVGGDEASFYPIQGLTDFRVGDFSRIICGTVADIQAGTTYNGDQFTPKAGQRIAVKERSNAEFEIKSSGTANGYDVIAVGSLFAELIDYETYDARFFGVIGDDANDDTAALQRALDVASGRKLNLTGDIVTTDTIIIPENTSVCGDSSTIRAGATFDPMFLNGDIGGSYPARSANSNISWSGGTIDLNYLGFGAKNGFAFGQAYDIDIDGIHFKNCQDLHFIEINAIERATVRNCTFETMHDSGSREYSEAVQIDCMFNSSVFPHFGGSSFDSTTCQEIRINNNFFKDCLTCIGSHTFNTYGDGTSTTACVNIEIKGVNSENCAWDCVRAEGWINSTLTDINADTCGNNVVRINASKNFAITNVSATVTTGNAIFLAGGNTFALQSGVISNITARTCQDGINLYKASNVTVTNVNVFDGRYGVQLSQCDDIIFSTIMTESCEKIIHCESSGLTQSSRLSGSAIHGRILSGDAITLYCNDSTISGCTISVPASGFSNCVFDACSNVSISDFFCNGATVSETFHVSGNSDKVVIQNCRNAGTGTNAVLIDSGSTDTLIQNNYFNGPSAIVDNGTDTIQQGNN